MWFPQPAPKNHPWRSMPHHGMTPCISLSAQARYAADARGTGEFVLAQSQIFSRGPDRVAQLLFVD